MSTKRCGRCWQDLPLDAFNRAGGGRQHWCRECFRVYFRERRTVHLAQVKEGVARRRADARRFIVEYLSEHPCVDCGESDVLVLEFDHLRDKLEHLSKLVSGGASRSKLVREIEKCDVVCVNCHRRRTAQRCGSWRCKAKDVRFDGMKTVVARNLRHVARILDLARCQDCGEPDLVVLDFDHVGPKRASVMTLAHGGYAFKALKIEIAECEIRCANCHKRRTTSVRGCYRAA